MKKQLIEVFIVTALITASGAIECSPLWTTLKAYEASDQAITKPYRGAIELQDNGENSPAKRAIKYRITLDSTKCHSILEGQAKFFAKKDGMGDDSTFLRNGEAVDTNIFKGSGVGGDVTIIMDVSSRRPRYASVSVDDAYVIAGGCVKGKKFGIDFY
jgi:hypothetical protein